VMDNEKLTLSEALKHLGYAHGPGFVTGKRSIFRGPDYIGDYDCVEAWQMLRKHHPNAVEVG